MVIKGDIILGLAKPYFRTHIFMYTRKRHC